MANAIDELIRELKAAENHAVNEVFAACGRLADARLCLSQIKPGKGRWVPVGRVILKINRLYAIKRPGSSASVARWTGLHVESGRGWENVFGTIASHGITLLVWVSKEKAS